MEEKKNKGGRPRVPVALSVRNITTTIRVHNDVSELLKGINKAFRAGKISYNDISGLLNKRNLQNKIAKEEKRPKKA